jgi:hypothetical protein
LARIAIKYTLIDIVVFDYIIFPTESYVWNTGRDNTIFKTKLDWKVNIKINHCMTAWELSDWIN